MWAVLLGPILGLLPRIYASDGDLLVQDLEIPQTCLLSLAMADISGLAVFSKILGSGARTLPLCQSSQVGKAVSVLNLLIQGSGCYCPPSPTPSSTCLLRTLGPCSPSRVGYGWLLPCHVPSALQMSKQEALSAQAGPFHRCDVENAVSTV